MTSEDIIRMAREAGFNKNELAYLGDNFTRFAELVRADEREQVAAWMRQQGYATGHGETIEDLLQEIEWQVAEREREAIETLVESLFDDPDDAVLKFIVDSIRARRGT